MSSTNQSSASSLHFNINGPLWNTLLQALLALMESKTEDLALKQSIKALIRESVGDGLQLVRITRTANTSRNDGSAAEPTGARYSIGTLGNGKYTPQIGLSVPSINMTRAQLRVATRELRAMHYECHRIGNTRDGHEDFSPYTLIIRTDGDTAYQALKRFWNW